MSPQNTTLCIYTFLKKEQLNQIGAKKKKSYILRETNEKNKEMEKETAKEKKKKCTLKKKKPLKSHKIQTGWYTTKRIRVFYRLSLEKQALETIWSDARS